MNRIAILLVAVGTLLATPAAVRADEAVVIADDAAAVEAAIDQWVAALNAMLNTDPAPFAELYSHADDVVYMGVEGTYRLGWKATWEDWQAQAAKSSGGKVEATRIHVVVNGDTATAAHVTRGKVRQPDGLMNDTAVRETSVLRKEDGRWRMVLHHADAIASWEAAFDD
jgi:uncharacterized protein (TIGR02246 family)